jgi:hypothetical protein
MFHRAFFVYGLAQHVEDPAQGGVPTGTLMGAPGINDFHAPHQTIGGAHGNSPHLRIAQQLLHLTGNGYRYQRGFCP